MSTRHREGDLLLDKYRVDRVLGEGGFGTTYAAVDEQGMTLVHLASGMDPSTLVLCECGRR